MNILILGLVLWSLVHLVPSLTPGLKQHWVKALGQVGYQLSFAVLIFVSLGLVIYGWRHTIPSQLYQPLGTIKPIAMLLMLVAFILFASAKSATRIKQFVRHPQLMSVAIWGIAHLLLNGDSRSVVLFGGMAVWAFLETITINRRDGTWLKPTKPTWLQEIKGLAIALVLVIVAVMAHPYIAGVAIR